MSDDGNLMDKTFAGLLRLHAHHRLPPADEAFWIKVRDNYLGLGRPMSDSEPIPSLAEALTEIRRLRALIANPENEATEPPMRSSVNTYVPPQYASVPKAWLDERLAEIQRLRARILELEAVQAVTLGTLEKPTEDVPARYTHNVSPSAPPHNEPPSGGNDHE